MKLFVNSRKRKICQLVDTLARLFGKIRTNASLADNYSTGRQPLLQNNHLAFIDQKMQENDELTSIGT